VRQIIWVSFSVLEPFSFFSSVFRPQACRSTFFWRSGPWGSHFFPWLLGTDSLLNPPWEGCPDPNHFFSGDLLFSLTPCLRDAQDRQLHSNVLFSTPRVPVCDFLHPRDCVLQRFLTLRPPHCRFTRAVTSPQFPSLPRQFFPTQLNQVFFACPVSSLDLWLEADSRLLFFPPWPERSLVPSPHHWFFC